MLTLLTKQVHTISMDRLNDKNAARESAPLSMPLQSMATESNATRSHSPRVDSAKNLHAVEYLQQSVFPVLLPALEKLLSHVKDLEGAEEEQEFNPLNWLAQVTMREATLISFQYLYRHKSNAAGRQEPS